MAEVSWPSPSHGTPARAVTDTEYPRLIPWSADGIFPDVSDLVYANSSAREVHVRANRYAIVRGHAWASGTSEFNLTIAANTSGKTRIDTVVIRLDKSTWNANCVVRQGTPGAGAPTLQRDAGDTGLWEIPAADVTVLNGAASIAGGNVKSRPLLQAAASRACTVITDIQTVLVPGDIVYETSTGRWIGWNGTAGQILYQDTGWQSYSVASSKFSAGGLPMKVRAKNGWCYVKGNALVEGTISIQAGTSEPKVAQLPSGFAPVEDHVWLAPIGQSAAGRMRLYPSGLITITAMPVGSLSEGQGVYLDTSYLLG
ncbi:hypothetical protein NE236_41300 [Actinoallomurus purpureus]|uniref:hypothetical protein n=1 Tax=Actinoallomurus purpureus TaxID=478114 RepID=UPI002093FF4F|nr:hypothetical protein [Actinoallomurus purpureus]MCO6011406.1 hypothetical protein [Actinoallomurus purpureus]